MFPVLGKHSRDKDLPDVFKQTGLKLKFLLHSKRSWTHCPPVYWPLVPRSLANQLRLHSLMTSVMGVKTLRGTGFSGSPCRMGLCDCDCWLMELVLLIISSEQYCSSLQCLSHQLGLDTAWDCADGLPCPLLVCHPVSQPSPCTAQVLFVLWVYACCSQ